MDFSKPRLKSKPHALCKNHPKHRQSSGVCSLCLNEKLSKLANHGHFPKLRGGKTRFSPSTSSYISSLSTSSTSSSCSSPVVKYGKSRTRGFKNGSTTMGDVLEKSRSMAFGWWRRKDEKKNGVGKGVERKRWRFWSRFLLPENNNNNDNNNSDDTWSIMQSRTKRERVITAVH